MAIYNCLFYHVLDLSALLALFHLRHFLHFFHICSPIFALCFSIFELSTDICFFRAAFIDLVIFLFALNTRFERTDLNFHFQSPSLMHLFVVLISYYIVFEAITAHVFGIPSPLFHEMLRCKSCFLLAFSI